MGRRAGATGSSGAGRQDAAVKIRPNVMVVFYGHQRLLGPLITSSETVAEPPKTNAVVSRQRGRRRIPDSFAQSRLGNGKIPTVIARVLQRITNPNLIATSAAPNKKESTLSRCALDHH